MLNQCQFIGHLGADPDTRHTQDGKTITNISLGVTEKWKKDGEPKERTEWVRAVAFGPLADVISKYAHKGMRVFIQGKMQTRKWQDKDGNDRYSTEIVLQGPGSVFQMLGGSDRQSPDQAAQQSGGQSGLDDSEIPF